MSPWSKESLPDPKFNVQQVVLLGADEALIGGNASHNAPSEPRLYRRDNIGRYTEVWRHERGRSVLGLTTHDEVVWLLVSTDPQVPSPGFSDYELHRSDDAGRTWTLRSHLPRRISAYRLLVGPDGDLWVHGAGTLIHSDPLGISWDDVSLPGDRNPFAESLILTDEGPVLYPKSTGEDVQVVWEQGSARAGRRGKKPVYFSNGEWIDMAPGTTGRVLDLHVDEHGAWAMVSRTVGNLTHTVDLLSSTNDGRTWKRRGSVVASTIDRPYDIGTGGRVISGDLLRRGIVWVRQPDI